MKYRNLLLFTLLLAAIITGAFWYSRSDAPAIVSALPPLLVESPAVPVPAATPAPVVASKKLEFKGGLSPEEAGPEAFSSNPPRSDEETRVIKIATSDLPDVAKVDQLLNLLPTLTPDAQLVAMEHATNLIPEPDYLRYRPRLFQLAKDDDLREAVMIDVLTRGENVRLPTLVEMLRLPPNKGQQDAREILEAYLEKDYGPDATKWEAPLRVWLAANAE